MTTPLKLVTIVCEGLLEERLLADLRALGIHGHTITSVRGEGSRGVRASEWEGEIKVETVVAPEVADRILAHLGERYFPRYAVIAYTADVEVVRADKYR